MRRSILILGLAAALMGGCSMAPDYKRPDLPVQNAWPQGTVSLGATRANGATPAAELDWRDFLPDEAMRELVRVGLENNRDLRVAILNIEKSRAQYRIQRADRLPTVNAEGGTTQQRLPHDLSSTGQAQTTREYYADLGVSSFELDIFGRVKSLSDEALETYLATEEARRSTHISLVAELASDYLTLVAERERLAIVHDTVSSRSKSYDLTRHLFEAGQTTELDLRQAEASLETARAQEAATRTAVAQAENALRLALGAPLPKDIVVPDTLDKVVEPKDVPPGLPSDLLERRPDILQAEHQLKAANADIGAARANFFPKITITGTFGTASHELDGLFDANSQAWTFAPRAVLPIFDFGRNMATLEVSKASRSIAVAQYEKSIQTAFREVSDALAVRANLQERMAAQEKAVAADKRSLYLSEKRYSAGIDSFLPVLTAQRSLFASQLTFLSLRLERMNNLLTLYKTLGGGWTDKDMNDGLAGAQVAVETDANAQPVADNTASPSPNHASSGTPTPVDAH
ncbi:RND efflux system, outer membrane lipoprotein, NodT family [Desulfovibrio sp. X2]|uniref:efflux transporter outer membrane subunit n=1 Tax=Desulfovibrio sp. X2 TaxID=941449 RepID=UPI000358C4AD|nr:efflux transporter outer membrane subunit [Desulfovibrio sp. X2]EPR38723.1 RND efflux system, outer membrane lipoprotein, NodT family [Desulfovibrio sp. X2]